MTVIHPVRVVSTIWVREVPSEHQMRVIEDSMQGHLFGTAIRDLDPEIVVHDPPAYEANGHLHDSTSRYNCAFCVNHAGDEQHTTEV